MKKIVYIILCFWLFVVFAFVVSQEYTTKTGKEVLLKTIPVDPRDLFMGDYVILNYDIAQLDDKYNFSNNETVYVELNVDKDNIAHASNISKTTPLNSLYLKGKIKGCNTIFPFIKNGKCVSFGIESYYVKENTGRKIEYDLREGALVKVAIDKNGNAKVKGFVK